MAELRSELLYDLTIELEAPREIGAGPRGTRQVFTVTRGRFEGPKLKGEVVPAVRDWFLQRPDGVGELDCRSTLKTDNGALIYVAEHGLVWGPPEVMAKAAEADPSLYYFRTTPRFETGAAAYSWLNRTLAVGVGRLTATGVSFRVYRVL